MTCLVVTCGGFGDVYSVESDAAAWLHPVTQDGDAVVCSHEDLLRNYNRLEWPRLMEMVGLSVEAIKDLLALPKEAVAAQNGTSERVWGALLRMSSPIPDNRDAIFAAVAKTRRAQMKGTMRMSADVAEKEPKASKEPKAPKDKVLVGPNYGDLNPKAVITYGWNKNAEPPELFSAEAGPYLKDSNREKRWRLLVSGMTVHDAVTKESGDEKVSKNTHRHLVDMAERGYIVITPPRD